MPRTEQKHVSLPKEMWNIIYDAARKQGVNPSRIVERLLIKPLNALCEELKLGKCDSGNLSTFNKIGQLSDKVGATSFACYSYQQFKKNKEQILEMVRNHWMTPEDGVMEIKLLRYRLKRSTSLQIAEDRKSFENLKKKGKIKS